MILLSDSLPSFYRKHGRETNIVPIPKRKKGLRNPEATPIAATE
jgi:hypothetical protein